MIVIWFELWIFTIEIFCLHDRRDGCYFNRLSVLTILIRMSKRKKSKSKKILQNNQKLTCKIF